MGTLGWGQDPGVRSCQPSGHAAGEPAWVSSEHPRVPGLGWGPATPRPVPPLPLTSPDVQGEGQQQAEPRAAGPPGSRCQAPRHPGAHPSHRRRGLGRRLRWPLAARHLPRPLGAGPTPPAGSRPPPAPPPARGSGSQTMEREPELEVGGTLSTWAAPPPRRVLVPFGSPASRRAPPTLEVGKKATALPTERQGTHPALTRGTGRALFAPSWKLLTREGKVTSSAFPPPHKQITCKGI